MIETNAEALGQLRYYLSELLDDVESFNRLALLIEYPTIRQDKVALARQASDEVEKFILRQYTRSK